MIALKACRINSIDIFYADNVFEHFFPDEAENIYFEVVKKLKKDANVFLIIPNRFIRPHDVSGWFLPFGSKAKGFHFMEMRFNDITKQMETYKINHSHCVFRIPKRAKMFCVKNKVLFKTKLKLEPIFAKIPFKFLRRAMFAIGEYGVSIMKCNK